MKLFDFQWLFSFMIVFAGYLFFSSPFKTPAQLIFRLILLFTGIIGVIVMDVLKKRSK